MTPPPKAARLLFPAIRWSEDTGFDHLEPEIARALELGVGGFILFGGEAERVRGLVDSLRTRSSVPLIIGSDLERGAGQQFRGCTALPPAWALGSLGDLETLWKAGELTAREARALGVDWVYAPVADLGNEPANPIVATRALGADPDAVARGVSAWILGCLAGGALPCAKHFPGHGRTLTDSHAELPLVADPVGVLAQDLIPFAAAVAAGVPSVMSAHVAFPALDPERLPATRSAPILQRVLRGRLGFEGVLVSDALIMEGAAQGASDEDAAVQAVRAGVDALLYPKDAEAVARALEGASREALPPGRLAEAVGRLDRMRRSIGYVQRPRSMSRESASAERAWGSERDRRWSRETALRTVAVLRAPTDALAPPSSLLIVDDDVGGPYPPPSRATFSDALQRLGVRVEVRDAAASSPPDEGGTRLVAVFADVRAWKGRVGLSERARAQLRDAVADQSSALVVLFSHPWNAVEVPPHAALLCAWGGEPLMQEAAARAVARLATS
jgi:beta-glucosidase-like glycosyl hydrolase